MAAFTVTLDEHEYSNMGVGGEVLTETVYWNNSKHLKTNVGINYYVFSHWSDPFWGSLFILI